MLRGIVGEQGRGGGKEEGRERQSSGRMTRAAGPIGGASDLKRGQAAPLGGGRGRRANQRAAPPGRTSASRRRRLGGRRRGFPVDWFAIGAALLVDGPAALAGLSPSRPVGRHRFGRLADGGQRTNEPTNRRAAALLCTPTAIRRSAPSPPSPYCSRRSSSNRGLQAADGAGSAARGAYLPVREERGKHGVEL